ncbi:MAG TPA: hypothetical protein VEO95_04375, partial [Chthoniobacteraceae bacterium]|nr:hypothetical protein [Chthoniobacteraceae bacterium]
APVAAVSVAPPRREKSRKLSYKESRELESIEADILAAENEVARLEAAFASPEFYAKHGHEWQQLEAQLKSAKERVPQLYARWEELERVKAGEASDTVSS